MKKSLLALAALTAFAGVASAQSSVTLYGRLDTSIGKNAGSGNKVMQNGSGSRFGVMGVEDLGGGLKARFQLEHRFNADTGADSNAGGRFWHGRSVVGLEGGFGQVLLGRDYTPAFLGSQLAADPWGWDTVAASTFTVGVTGGGIAPVRTDSSITYRISASGISFGAQIGEATDQFNNTVDKPTSLFLGYAGGPFSIGLGLENPGGANDKWTTVNGGFTIGAIKLTGLIGNGTTNANVKVKSTFVSATMTMGQGELRAAFGKRKNGSATTISGLGLGYHYALSKRTTLYADYARNSKLATQKTAYDVGIKHNF
ncbi:MAG: porin [Aquabacterium sp.]